MMQSTITAADTYNSGPIYISLSEEHAALTIQENVQATIILQCDASANIRTGVMSVMLQRNAFVRIFICMTQTIIETVTIELLLEGAGAHAQVYGIVALNNAESVTIKTVQKHDAPHAQSQVIIKALVADSAQLHYQGLISVDKNADNTHAAQQNKNMLLSEHARAYARPSLEVKTNEVKCFHGTATGPLDKNQLLYLMSRGIEQKHAQQLLIHAFIADVLQGVSLVEQKKMIQEIMNKIERAE